MPSFESNESVQKSSKIRMLPVLIALMFLTATFLISNLNLTFTAKLAIFIALVFLYIFTYAAFYFRRSRKNSSETVNLKSVEVEAALLAFDEARIFFGASLKYADMFRLVAGRLNEIIPFAAGVLYAADKEKNGLQTQFAVGADSREFSDLKISVGSGLVGRVLESRTAQIAGELSKDEKAIAVKAFDKLQSGIAVPLFREAELFGVMVLYGGAKNQFDQNSLEVLQAAAARIAPLFTGAQTFENNLNSALLDSLTALPNERGFYLVLENQIAEAQRFRGERMLTVLTFDIKNFSEINRSYGHLTGDRIIGFVAEKIKSQLRQMDFLARSTGDDFLLILPTASEDITREIVERVRKTFALNAFEISGEEKVQIQLNFGAASFIKDGETADDLVKHALLRKRQSKSSNGENKILFFPKEFVN